MRCQDVERLIIDGREPGPEERAKMDAHLARCARCSDLREFWQSVHERAAKIPAPELPSGLSEKVRLAAHAELVSRLGSGPPGKRRQPCRVCRGSSGPPSEPSRS